MGERGKFTLGNLGKSRPNRFKKSEKRRGDEKVDLERRRFVRNLLIGSAGLAGGAVLFDKIINKLDWIIDNEDEGDSEKKSEQREFSPKERSVSDKSEKLAEEEKLTKVKDQEVVDGTIRGQLLRYGRVNMKTAKESIYRKWYDVYKPGGEEHKGMLDSLSRMQPWLAEMKEVFRDAGVDEKFIYLVIPESRFEFENPSPAHADGPFQFLAGTARDYGLICNKMIDERLDPIKSAKAAARYLSKLFDQYGNVELGLAAYNGSYAKKYRLKKKDKNEPMSYPDYLQYREDRINNYIGDARKVGHLLHKVESGQNISIIAKIYQISQESIRKVNGFAENEDKIIAGRKIKLPVENCVIVKKLAASLENLNYPEKFLAVWQVLEDNRLRSQFPATGKKYQTLKVPQGKKLSLEQKVFPREGLLAVAKRFRKQLIANLGKGVPSEKKISEMLREQNKLTKKSVLHPGQKVKLSLSLKKGASLQSLSRASGVSLSRLKRLNPAILATGAVLPGGYRVRYPF